MLWYPALLAQQVLRADLLADVVDCFWWPDKAWCTAVGVFLHPVANFLFQKVSKCRLIFGYWSLPLHHLCIWSQESFFRIAVLVRPWGRFAQSFFRCLWNDFHLFSIWFSCQPKTAKNIAFANYFVNFLRIWSIRKRWAPKSLCDFGAPCCECM